MVELEIHQHFSKFFGKQLERVIGNAMQGLARALRSES
jgi:hypothetical protein